MAKIINLDEVEVSIPKEFVFKGKTHKMKPLSVGDFIKNAQRLEAMKGQESTDSDAVNMMVDLVMTAFPSLDRADVLELDLQKLQVLTAYIQDDVTEETEAGNAQ